MVAGEAGVGGNVRENVKDEFIRKLENCRNETKEISIDPKNRRERSH